MAGNMPGEHFGQRCRLVGRFGFRGERRDAFRSSCDGLGAAAMGRARGEHRAKQIARGLGVRHHRFGEAHAEALVDAHEQLDASQAVEAVILLEPGIQGSGDGAGGVQLGGELAYGLDQRIRVDGRVDCSSVPCGRRFHLRAFNRSEIERESEMMLAQPKSSSGQWIGGEKCNKNSFKSYIY
jgi:hypothetical protein